MFSVNIFIILYTLYLPCLFFQKLYEMYPIFAFYTLSKFKYVI